MAENNLIADPLNLPQNDQYTTLAQAMKKATQMSKHAFGNMNNTVIPKIIPWLNSYESIRNINQSLENSVTKRFLYYEKSIHDSIIQKVLNTQSSISNNQLVEEKVIPFLLNKFISKLIDENTKKEYEVYNFECEGVTSFFYFSPDFTFDEVMSLNNEINERIIDLTNFFDMDELLKFSFVITAEELNHKEKITTFGMPCG